MRYQEFPEYDKTFVVMQMSGFGVMEAPYEDVGIVFSTDDEDEAYAKASSLREENNTTEQIKSSWVPNTYWVNANTSTEKGKELLKGFQDESAKSLAKAKASGNYHEHKFGNVTIGVIGDDSMFKNDHKVTGEAMADIEWDPTLQSWKYVMLDLSEPKKPA